jgi:hypothetical protein
VTARREEISWQDIRKERLLDERRDQTFHPSTHTKWKQCWKYMQASMYFWFWLAGSKQSCFTLVSGLAYFLS